MPKKIDATWKSKIGQKQLQQQGDNVNHPPHYQKGRMETIDIMQNLVSLEEFMGHLKCTVIKYLSRYEHKENPIQDLEKAEWYLKKLIETRKINDAYITLEKLLP